MKQLLSVLTAAVCLLVLPGSGWAVPDSGIPSMLETPHPIAVPASQPAPRAPEVETSKPAAPVSIRPKTPKKAQVKTGKQKATIAGKKKATKTAKKKGAAAKSRSKVAANR
jgi:hypothetical protein|uniref:Uncharacterized protein n=1 Tax=Desulfobacca acetoxidans TaxID=60893 RepID=A0A7V6A4I5_9BACT